MAGGHGVLDDWCGFLDGALASRRKAVVCRARDQFDPEVLQPAKQVSILQSLHTYSPVFCRPMIHHG